MNEKCCDKCEWYKWYWDWCKKWNCKCDARECHSCFDKKDISNGEENEPR